LSHYSSHLIAQTHTQAMLREEFIASDHKAQVTSSSHCGPACGTGDHLLVCGPMVVNCMVLNTIEYKVPGMWKLSFLVHFPIHSVS